MNFIKDRLYTWYISLVLTQCSFNLRMKHSCHYLQFKKKIICKCFRVWTILNRKIYKKNPLNSQFRFSLLLSCLVLINIWYLSDIVFIRLIFRSVRLIFFGFLCLLNDVTNDDVISRVVYKQTDERKMLWINVIFICNICVFVNVLPS